MNTELLDKYVVDVLRKHGWSEGRKRDTTYWIRVLSKEGYIVNDYAKSVLEELGDIDMNTRGDKNHCGVQLHFNPVYAGSGEYDRLEIFNAAAKEELFPIGECFSSTVYVSASKKVYLGDWTELLIAGNSIEDFLNRIFAPNAYFQEIYTNEEALRCDNHWGEQLNFNTVNTAGGGDDRMERVSSIMIEKNVVLGELLYKGFLLEKGRCKSRGLWKHTYIKSLKKHINLLNEIAMCMQKEFAKEEDTALLRKIFEEFQCDNVLKRAYRSKKGNVLDILFMENFVITDCNDENRHTKILTLILKLLEDVSLELDKGLKKDKRKICNLLFALHNLPRVYLSKEANTLLMMGWAGIGESDALQYSKSWMNEEMLHIYEEFL